MQYNYARRTYLQTYPGRAVKRRYRMQLSNNFLVRDNANFMRSFRVVHEFDIFIWKEQQSKKRVHASLQICLLAE